MLVSNLCYSHLEVRGWITERRTQRIIPDIKADNFWSRDRQSAFSDIRVFNPLAPSNRNHTLTSAIAETNRRKDVHMIKGCERYGSFTPQVFSDSGGMGPTARFFYKKLASMIATKHNKAYSKTLNWMRCRISFSLLRSAVMCLRGSRSSRGRLALPMVGEGDIEMGLIEGRVRQ